MYIYIYIWGTGSLTYIISNPIYKPIEVPTVGSTTPPCGVVSWGSAECTSGLGVEKAPAERAAGNFEGTQRPSKYPTKYRLIL